jgi:amino acid transporter
MFGLSLVSVLFAYDGWMNITYCGGEIANPRRNMPLSILFGVSAVAAIYITANIAYMIVSPVAEIAGSQIIAAHTMQKLVGTAGVTLIVATVMLSTFGALNAGMLSSPRIYFAMSEDRLFFEPLARVHPKFKTPYIAVGLCGILSVIYVLTGTVLSGSKAYAALIDACVVGNLPFYALAVGSIFIFRRREKKRAATATLDDSLVDPVEPGHTEAHPHAYSPPMHAPLYPLTPILFIASTLLLLGNSFVDPTSRIPSLIVLGILATGVPIYRAAIHSRSRSDA